MIWMIGNQKVRRMRSSLSVSMSTVAARFRTHPQTATISSKHLQLIENVITHEQEEVMISFVDSLVKRKRYDKSHFDDVITNYRETEIYPEKLQDFQAAAQILQLLESTIRQHFGGAEMRLIAPHVIDLHASGFIDAHVDSIKFSGDMIASLSLVSSRIMRLQLAEEFAHLYRQDDPLVPTTIEFIVPPRSVYILSGPMRYHYTHEILSESRTDLTVADIDIKRRLSIMLRDEKKH